MGFQFKHEIFGKPIVFGPHMHNQRALAQLCLEAGAARQVADAAELGEAVVALAGDAEGRRKMLGAAERLLAENRGASARCAAVVADLVHSQSGTRDRCPTAGVNGETGTGPWETDPRVPLRP